MIYCRVCHGGTNVRTVNVTEDEVRVDVRETRSNDATPYTRVSSDLYSDDPNLTHLYRHQQEAVAY
jgi:hypothetical protein